MRKVALVLVSVAAAWGLAYAGIWLFRSGCMDGFTLECLNAPATPLADFIMLDWIFDHPELAAGVLTLLGGGTAVLAVLTQISHSEKLAQRDTQLRNAGALARLQMRYRRLYGCEITQNWTTGLTLCTEVEAICDEVSAFAPDFALWLTVLLSGQQTYFRLRQQGNPVHALGRDTFLAGLACAQAYLDHSARLVDERGFFFNRKSTWFHLDEVYRSMGPTGPIPAAIGRMTIDWFE